MPTNKNKCSLCGSKGTRMTNCPLNKSAKNPDPKKHPNSVTILQDRANKSTKKLKKVNRTQPKKNYINPYIRISQVSCQYTAAIIKTLKKNRGVIITGIILKNLNFNINRPQSVKINIPHSIHNRDKLIEFVQLICDMVTQLGQYTVDKKDYFSKPNKEVLKLLQLVEGLKTEFIKFLLTFITRDGGTPEYIDNFLQPIDNIIETINTMEELMGLDNVFALSQLPDIPNSLPKIGKKNSEEEKIAIALDK